MQAQTDFFILKKGNKTIRRFHEKDPITFQLTNGDWLTGDIVSIHNDSFYFRQEIIHYYMMGTDTVHIGGYHFSLKDIRAFPKPGIRFRYAGNHLEVNGNAGHVHWYWIKGGFLFRAGALGYAGLHTVNGLIDKDLAFTTAQALIPAGLFLGGVLLKKKWKYYIPVAGKYHLSYIHI
jgi:hypothetical protein